MSRFYSDYLLRTLFGNSHDGLMTTAPSKKLMGHASPVTTAIYTAISPTRARAAVDALALPA